MYYIISTNIPIVQCDVCYVQNGISDAASHSSAQKILLKLGEFFQIEVTKNCTVYCFHYCISDNGKQSCVGIMFLWASSPSQTGCIEQNSSAQRTCMHVTKIVWFDLSAVFLSGVVHRIKFVSHTRPTRVSCTRNVHELSSNF